MLAIRPGDTRRVSSITLRAGDSSQSGHRTALNDAGEVVFGASFNSGALGTANFLIDLGGVPPDNELLTGAFGEGGWPAVKKTDEHVELTFQRRIEAAFSYAVEASDSLTTWSPFVGDVQVSADQSGVPAGYQRVFAIVPIDGGMSQLRVRISIP